MKTLSLITLSLLSISTAMADESPSAALKDEIFVEIATCEDADMNLSIQVSSSAVSSNGFSADMIAGTFNAVVLQTEKRAQNSDATVVGALVSINDRLELRLKNVITGDKAVLIKDGAVQISGQKFQCKLN